MQDFEHILFEKQGAIARIQLNRPDAANGLDTRMSDELNRVARLCDTDPELKAVILTASGRFFCAGGDIKEMQSHGDDVGNAVKALPSLQQLHAEGSVEATRLLGLMHLNGGYVAPFVDV